ncbi:hypothetical protein DS2_15989 [Catenovulum agarivorans DS-2]|uniref:MSHA pilin protein MshA n=1 Tax=Catenovulum agarivorans DS-2 TaxID=1328313 RepID=W7QTJ0_9ALTE|nr:type II secretion system protein [Catenovulum agarivorans]EWH08750.1 hypothetical protein DS2_15989 [Catenovulum agarivorans DS-2]
MKRSQQQGFTLIELIVVIVILGILAVTAAPRFIDVQDEAELSVAKAIEGSIVSAVNMVHAKALVQNTLGNNAETAVATTVVADGHVDTDYGYPESTAQGIGAIIDIPSDWSIAYSGNTATFSKGDCSVVYTQPTSTAEVGRITTSAECDP